MLGFLVFLWRGLRIAAGRPISFGRLLAIGVTAMVVIQALINFIVVTSLVPNKGIPLPFISYGGSVAGFFAGGGRSAAERFATRRVGASDGIVASNSLDAYIV